MGKYSIEEIMEMAIQTEKLGFKFYTTIAEKFKKDDGLVKLFKTLADKEKVHEKTFTDLKVSVEKSGVDVEPVQWEEVSNYMRAFVESEFFLGKSKALPSMDHIRTVADAVKFAIGFEKETLLYFMELKSIVKEKDVIDKVINEEKSHVRWLDSYRVGLAK
ncbi:MAG TPA: ferritin family protein [Nitrospirota bacterium]|nr:ferritin family protein [Nitrospirota bacterium]